MRCLSCHYDLKNLPENRCPECGREFDPANQATFAFKRDRRISRRRCLVVAVLTTFFSTFTLSLIVMMIGGTGEGLPEATFIALISAAAAVPVSFLVLYGIDIVQSDFNHTNDKPSK